MFEIVNEQFGGDVKIIRPKTFEDERGWLTVSYLEDEMRELGLPTRFVRQIVARSAANVLRGLHYQWTPAMGKLMQVLKGEAYMVTVDLRHGSPTFLMWRGLWVTEYNRLQVWAPAGFARGYYSLVAGTIVHYNCDAYQGVEKVIHWNDPDIGIKWPLNRFGIPPVVSEKDFHASSVRDEFGKDFRYEDIH